MGLACFSLMLYGQAAKAERLRDLEYLGNKAQEAANVVAKELQGSQAALRDAAKANDTRDAALCAADPMPR